MKVMSVNTTTNIIRVSRTGITSAFAFALIKKAKNIANVEQMSGGRELPHIPPWEFRWPESESPEAPIDGEVHYLMTPYHALSLALAGEQRAADFFAMVAESASDAVVREMASQLRDEEREHVSLVEEWLHRYPEPDSDWDDDPDPPLTQE